MRAIPLVGVAALALAACQAEDAATDNQVDVTTITEDDAGTADPALTDLNIESSADEVDRAVNQTDSQSNLDNALEGAAESVENGI